MDITQYLLTLADRLDAQGKTACVTAIEGLIKEASVEKVAQYVGVIGYVLKQNRAMSNCIRKKRVASDGPMQKIVMDCLQEYQDGQKYTDDVWTSKYAEVITQEPKLFDVSHLSFLQAVAEENDFARHLSFVKAACDVLDNHGEKDEVLDDLVNTVASVSDVLRKESSRLPFVTAAPLGNATSSERGLPSRRKSRWQRMLFPTQVSANPFSWSRSLRNKGEDQETLMELSMVAEGLYDVSRVSQQMRTNIGRLKSQVNGYLKGSGSGLTGNPKARFQQEDAQTIDNIVAHVERIDPKDWNGSLLALHQLQYVLEDQPVRNEYNRNTINQAKKIVQNITNNINVVYEKLDSIQDAMSTLGRRTTIMGTEPAVDKSGRPNPLARFSPEEEFGVLEELLDKIYDNPFDEESLVAAKRANTRLNRKLRYMDNPDAANSPESTSPVSPEGAATSESEVGPESPGTSSEPAEEPLDNEKVTRLSGFLRGKIQEMNITPAQFKEVMQAVIMGLGASTPINPTTQRYLNAIMDSLEAPEAGPASPPGTGDSNPTSAPSVVPDVTDSNPQLDAIPTPEEAFPVSPGKPGNGVNTDDTVDFSTWDDVGENETDAGIMSGELEDDKKRMMQRGSSSWDLLVKIGDVLDAADPSFGQVIDDYLRQMAEDSVGTLPEQPNIAEIIKEKEGVVGF